MNGLALAGVDAIAHGLCDSSLDLLVTVEQVKPRVLDSVGGEQGVGRLGDRLPADLAVEAGRLAELDAAGGVHGESTRAQAEADHPAAGAAGGLVEGLVGSELCLVVGGEEVVVDRGVVLVPLAGGPPRGAGAAGARVGDEEEALDEGGGGGGVDEVDGGVAVDLVGLGGVSVSERILTAAGVADWR